MSRGDQEQRSQRQLRVAEQMRHLLAECLMRGEVHDPRLASRSLTVTEVRISRDLKAATVYMSELGRDLDTEALVALDRAAAFLGGWLARQMHLKYAPTLRFVADETFARAARINQLLHETQAALRDDEEDGDGSP